MTKLGPSMLSRIIILKSSNYGLESHLQNIHIAHLYYFLTKITEECTLAKLVHKGGHHEEETLPASFQDSSITIPNADKYFKESKLWTNIPHE